jgi:hypothetical protein
MNMAEEALKEALFRVRACWGHREILAKAL